MIRHTLQLSNNRVLHQFWGHTSNVYILVCHSDKTTYLIDCGMPADVKPLIDILRYEPPVKRVVCTHFHVDHIAAWIQFSTFYPSAEIWFSKTAEPLISGQTVIPFPDLRAFRDILIPCMREYAYLPDLRDIFHGALFGTPFKKGFPTDRLKFFNDTQFVLPGFTSIPTPGHRPEEVSFWDSESRVFISGDFIVVLNHEVKLNRFVSNHQDQLASLQKIKDLCISGNICPGHGQCRTFDAALL